MITELEFKVLQGIDHSEYGDHLEDQVWNFSIIPEGVTPKQVAGAIGSLKKKGLVECGNWEGKEFAVGMSSEGVLVYLTECYRKDKNFRFWKHPKYEVTIWLDSKQGHIVKYAAPLEREV